MHEGGTKAEFMGGNVKSRSGSAWVSAFVIAGILTAFAALWHWGGSPYGF
jgi:hypothetical protein